MLSRNAEGLYWSARLMQRADTMARLLEMGNRLSMMPSIKNSINDDINDGYANEWQSILTTIGMEQKFDEFYEEPSYHNIVEFLFFNEDNPASIYNCIINARQQFTGVSHIHHQRGVGGDESHLF